LKRGDFELSRSLPIDVAIECTLQAWPTYHGGDPNLTDILFLANTIREDCNLQLEDVPLTKEQVVSIVELVEKELLHNPEINPIWMDKLAIRAKSKDQITQELSTLGRIVLRLYPQFISMERSVMVSLYMWYGCLNMDKVCRKVTAQGRTIIIKSMDKKSLFSCK
jgi:hypothetical protein